MSNKKDIIDRFKKMYVAAASDAADRIGVGSVSMDYGIGPMTLTNRIVGFANTAKLKRAPKDRPYEEDQMGLFMSLASKSKQYDVIILNMAGSYDCAGWGQITSRIAKSSGAVGTVVDGMIRDIIEVDKMDYPVFARGFHPATIRGRLIVDSLGEPTDCGGLTVHPEDLIFGDRDGVVVIPRDRVEDVLASAEEVVGIDTWWDENLKKGKDPQELQKEKPMP